MNQKTFTLTIAKVNEQLFNGEAHSVTLPGTEGEMTILGGHVPLISLLKSGTITVRAHGEEKVFTIQKGVLEISEDHVTVLV
jgi:F-type H+-transporting ATPase subunit epsilon